jgi:hypothetical protein
MVEKMVEPETQLYQGFQDFLYIIPPFHHEFIIPRTARVFFLSIRIYHQITVEWWREPANPVVSRLSASTIHGGAMVEWWSVYE